MNDNLMITLQHKLGGGGTIVRGCVPVEGKLKDGHTDYGAGLVRQF